MFMSLRQLQVSASTLGSHMRAGISLIETMRVLAVVQEEYAEHWTESEKKIASGGQLYECLNGVWPEALVSTIRAGEESGQVDPILSRICASLTTQELVADAMKKLRYPALVALAGILMFFGLMIFGVPITARALHAEHSNMLTELSMAMESYFKNYWVITFIALAAFATKGYNWSVSSDGRDAIRDLALRVPRLKEAMINIHFGIWANYMELVLAAGIPTTRALLITMPILPSSLRHGLELAEYDLTTRHVGLEDIVNLNKLSPDDPRRQWPMFIRNAVVVGDRAGGLDEQFGRVGPELVKMGLASFTAYCKVAETFCTVASAAVVGVSFAGIYGPILGAISAH